MVTFSADLAATPVMSQAKRLLLGDGELVRHAADAAGGLAVNLALAGLILAATLWASNWLADLTQRAIARAHRRHRADTTLQTFAGSLVRYAVIVVGLIGVLQQLGVKATSVIAVLGAASLAIGLALQGALANVAAGVMLLILRPYRVGDEVEIHGRQGVVTGLDLFSTRLADPDNLSVFVPNAKAFGEIIVNHTSTSSRRVQIDFTIDRRDDVDRAMEVLLVAARADGRVVLKPAPWAGMTGFTDHGIRVTLRAWTAPRDFSETLSGLLRTGKRRLEAAGFSFPYPHQVAVEGRPFDPPRALRRPAKAPSRRPAVPRPTTAGSSKGR